MKYVSDKRIDNIVNKLGHPDAEIFYSPIDVALVSIFAQYFFLFFLYIIIKDIQICKSVVTYLLAHKYAFSTVVAFHILGSYCLSAYLNNNFALTENNLFVINPNFPFKRIVQYPLEDIEVVEIGTKKLPFPVTYLFPPLIGDCNYVRIKGQNDERLFFCVGLEPDYYDENFVGKIIDNLDYSLKEKGVITHFSVYN